LAEARKRRLPPEQSQDGERETSDKREHAQVTNLAEVARFANLKVIERMKEKKT